uniref:sulfite reductase n=1 Tax=Aliarcobacter sp. TaxID=2321116 RepID=UPI0040471E25
MANDLALNIEQIKKEKNGLDVLADIYIYAVFGEKVTQKDLIRFSWYGIYSQDENQNYFFLRIPLSMGQLNITQIKTLSNIAKNYGDDNLILSSTQKVELKNLKIYDLPKIFNLLQEVELNTFFESGHNVKRVLTCPVNGIDETQLFDVSDLANKLNNTFIGNNNFYNLPNSLQIAISGYEEGCDVQYTPDVSFNAIKDNKEKIIFAVKILDKTIGYVTPAQVINTAKEIANLYRDFGDREDLENNSFEKLVHSWGFDKFFDVLYSSTNYKIEKNILIKSHIPIPRKPRMGINSSKIENQSYIGCRLKSSVLNSTTLDTLCLLLEKYEASKIKITHKANVIVLDVPSQSAEKLAKELVKIDFNPFDSYSS